MSDNPIVQYKGAFTDAQKQAIDRVTTRIETLCNMRFAPLEFGARWVAVAQELGPGRTLYMASRMGKEGVITGETVGELVEKIENAFSDREGLSG